MRRQKRSAYFFAGEVAGEAPPLAAAGDAFVLLAGAGVPPGLAASADAGRMPPRLAGLASMFAENWFTIFASDRATSSRAALMISLRWFVNATVICWRTPWLS